MFSYAFDCSAVNARGLHLMTALPKGMGKEEDMPTTHAVLWPPEKLMLGEATAGTARCNRRRSCCSVIEGEKDGGK